MEDGSNKSEKSQGSFLREHWTRKYCCSVGEGKVKDAPREGMGPVLGVTCSRHHIFVQRVVGRQLQGTSCLLPQISAVGRMIIPRGELNYLASWPGRAGNITCRQRNVCLAPLSNLSVHLSSGSLQQQIRLFLISKILWLWLFKLTHQHHRCLDWVQPVGSFLLYFLFFVNSHPIEWPPCVEISKGFNFRGLVRVLRNSKHKIASHSSRGDHNSL